MKEAGLSTGNVFPHSPPTGYILSPFVGKEIQVKRGYVTCQHSQLLNDPGVLSSNSREFCDWSGTSQSL